MRLSPAEIAAFQSEVWEYYHDYGRHDLPWRKDTSPYSVCISEIMLQQTQVSRVIDAYGRFMEEFPDFETLARAPFSQVLRIWSGLGYNRRARYLHDIARVVVEQHEGRLPDDVERLQDLKGIGVNTAGSIAAFAYSQPVVFIETNIRSLYIHRFFTGEKSVADSELLPLIEASLDREDPRQWYWALMDYGVHIKYTVGNTSRASRHYTKQSRFEGSRRQLRGQLLKQLAIKSPQPYVKLAEALNDERLATILGDLNKEGLIVWDEEEVSIAD